MKLIDNQQEIEQLRVQFSNLREIRVRAEGEFIVEVLKKVNFNKAKAAEVLDVDRKTIYNKLREFGELSGKSKVIASGV